MQNTDNKTINAKEIFTAEKELFEITQMIDYTQLEKNQQKELKDNLNRGYYKKQQSIIQLAGGVFRSAVHYMKFSVCFTADAFSV